MSGKVNTLYIGAPGRSGSTVLAQVLGRIPGFVNVGELWQIWDRGLQENELCGCGQPFHSCEFWNTVGDEAFNGWHNVDAGKMITFKPVLRRLRYVPQFVLAAKLGVYRLTITELINEYGHVLEQLYDAIKRVSGAEVIVDSSKRLSYAFLLSKLSSIDLRVIRLIRDSRAVAYSRMRTRARPEIVDRRVYMPQMGPAHTSQIWNIHYYMYNILPVSEKQSRLRYEDFISDPAFHLSESLSELGFDCEPDSFPFAEGREISLATDHTVSGNPSRFHAGSIRLRPDYEWKAKMGRTDKYLVTAMTAPLLLKYGYLRRGGKAE